MEKGKADLAGEDSQYLVWVRQQRCYYCDDPSGEVTDINITSYQCTDGLWDELRDGCPE